MRINTFGKQNNPIIIMLPGSFSSSKSMEKIYSLLQTKYYIIVPDYTGHYKDSSPFSTRKEEAEKIKKYLTENNISKIKLIYGQSMGSEIGMELLHQVLKDGITVYNAFFDGAPYIKLSYLYKKFMYFKFKCLVNISKRKSIDEIMNWKFLKQFTGDKIEHLRPMLNDIIQTSKYITKETIKNETECCYTFDFPHINEKMQKNVCFFYGEDEKAYKTCFKYIEKYYPYSRKIVKSNQGHLTYSCKYPEEYTKIINDFIQTTEE